MWNAAIVCLISTLIAWQVRESLPVADGTEAVRQIHLWLGFVAMGAIDAFAILLIRYHGRHYRRLTTPLTVILSLSILNHSLGAFAYAAENFIALDWNDWIANALGVAQIGVFIGWWSNRHGRDRRFYPRHPRSDRICGVSTLRDRLHAARHE